MVKERAGLCKAINYGIRETSLDLLSKYGFWIPDNPVDDYIDWNMAYPQWTKVQYYTRTR
jgi:hypothetical protein